MPSFLLIIIKTVQYPFENAWNLNEKRTFQTDYIHFQEADKAQNASDRNGKTELFQVVEY